MEAGQTPEVLQKVVEIATTAGLHARIDEDAQLVMLGVAIDDTRRQTVCVRDTTRDPKHRIITVFSPAVEIKKTFISRFSKKMALELLRANENIHFARYGILETDTSRMVVASTDHLLDKLDPEELEFSVFSVAMAADMYEKKFGHDVF